MGKEFKVLRLFLLMTFAVAYCHFATEVIFNEELRLIDAEFIKREYFQSLFVGFCASAFGVLGYFLFLDKKRSKTDPDI